MKEAEAHEFYKNPDHLAVTAGAGAPPPQRLKSGLIPVRFTPDMIAAVKRLAHDDGVTVSTWIRRLVGRELQRRIPSETGPRVEVPAIRVDYSASGPTSETRSDQKVLAGICL
ncbi:MAG: hypothetical protein ACRDRJ_13540 [Streptosporangiaceae bacterium]